MAPTDYQHIIAIFDSIKRNRSNIYTTFELTEINAILYLSNTHTHTHIMHTHTRSRLRYYVRAEHYSTMSRERHYQHHHTPSSCCLPPKNSRRLHIMLLPILTRKDPRSRSFTSTNSCEHKKDKSWNMYPYARFLFTFDIYQHYLIIGPYHINTSLRGETDTEKRDKRSDLRRRDICAVCVVVRPMVSLCAARMRCALGWGSPGSSAGTAQPPQESPHPTWYAHESAFD